MGQEESITETHARQTHFTWDERLELQHYYCGQNKFQRIRKPGALGYLLGKSAKTITREIKRGMVSQVNSDLIEVIVYSAEYAQRDAEEKSAKKGPQVKLANDQAFVEAVSKLVREKHYSPYAVIEQFNRTAWPSNLRICEKTLYTYIQQGDIPGISVKDLLYGGKRYKPKSRPKRHLRAENAIRSISKRPKVANERTEVGHWEMDTVYSGKECSSTCLLTLTERKTRTEIIRQIPDRTASSVKAEIDEFEREMGTDVFRGIFKSITPDNGAEFSDAQGLEKSMLADGSRTQLFFAHPYSSFERGTNENHNGIIRRFIPKGSDIAHWTQKSIREIQDWMNNYPRKILGGDSPMGELGKELGAVFRIPSLLEIRI